MIVRKIMLLGDMAVGKTSIANRLAFDRFEASYKSTIGFDLYRYDVKLPDTDDHLQFLIWDTDGNVSQAMFRDQHMKGAQAAIVVGDLTRRETMLNQLALGQEFIESFPGRYVAGVLNKRDLSDDIPEDDDHIPAGLRAELFPVLETSAKSGLNVERAFTEAAETIVRRRL